MRLTNEKRDALKNQIISKMFSDERKSLDEKRVQICEDIFSEAVDESLASNFPEGWLPEVSSISIFLTGNLSIYADFQAKKRCPNRYLRYSETAQVPEAEISKLNQKRVSDYVYAKKDFLEKKHSAEKEVHAILYSVNTSNQLKELWPEIFKVIDLPEDESKPTNQLMPLVDKFNKQLKLK